MRWFYRLTLSRQFLVASFPVLLVGMLAIGLWVEREIESGVLTRIAEVQSLYVDSVVAPHLAGLLRSESLDAQQKDALDALFVDTPLGRKIVAFILWRPDGRILYSNVPELVGRQVNVGRGLRTALEGKVYAKVIDRGTQPHPYANASWPRRLIEVYAPVHTAALGATVGAAEFYQTTTELDAAMREARWRTWGVVAATTLVMYLLLFGFVRRGSQTIVAQREELTSQVSDLSSLARANAGLADKLRRASARTAALNEGMLRRVACDLHDGPAQDLGFAKMRVESMATRASSAPDAMPVARTDIEAVRAALDLAMTDLRAICAGLQLPDLEPLQPSEVVARAVRDYERKTGVAVVLACSGETGPVALPIRITLFRVLQEMLANGFRHGGAIEQEVRLACAPDELRLTVSDRGPGFDAAAASTRTHGGLAGMRERVRALGGTFDVTSRPGMGTMLVATLPTQVAETGDD